MRRNSRSKSPLGLTLKRLRHEAGLSQGDVAKVMGYGSPQFVSNWERGISEPPIQSLAKLAELYKVAPETLLEPYVEFRLQDLEAEIRSRFGNKKARRSYKAK